MKDMSDDKIIKKCSESGIKWAPVKKFTTTQECITFLGANEFKSYATSSHQAGKDNISLIEGEYKKPQKMAIWFGNEGNGLSKDAIDYCKTCIQIPSLGAVPCLNISCCVSIVLFHITNHR